MGSGPRNLWLANEADSNTGYGLGKGKNADLLAKMMVWGGGGGRFASQDGSGSRKDRVGAAKDHGLQGKDGFGTRKDRVGTGKDHVGTRKDRGGTGKDPVGTRKDHVGSGKDQVGTGKDQGGRGKDLVRKHLAADERG
ncbi:MAG: hypothetical protein QOD75_3534 [Blastocatellia bacterium]|nr:hypothetical protein [Blastocatellia bacterium]